MTPTPGCPSCAAPLTGAPACEACGLPLTGPLAAQLWQVDQQLAALDGQREWLRQQRSGLLEQLRTGQPPPAAWPPPVPVPAAPEASPVRVQNTLLTLGAVLLALAGVVFAAVTYRNLGVVGRATALALVTTGAGWAPVWLRRRGLTASAESVGAVAMVLAVLDTVVFRKAGFADGVDGASYYSAATAVVAVGAAAYATQVPIRAASIAASLVGQLPVPLALVAAKPSLPVVAVTLTTQAAVDLVGWSRQELPAAARRTLLWAVPVLGLIALSVSARAASEHDAAGGAGLVAVAALLVLSSVLVVDQTVREAVLVPTVPLLGGAALIAVHDRLTSDQQPLVLVAVTLAVLPALSLLPPVRRLGSVLSALVLSSISVLVQAGPVLEAIAGPFTWLGDPWSRTADTARAALATDFAWNGTVVTLVTLVGAAVAAISAGLLVERLDTALPAAGALVVLSAVTLPLGLATSYRDALALLLLVSLVIAAAGAFVLIKQRQTGLALAASATATALLAASWSAADQDTTLTVLPLAALVVAGLSLALPGALTAITLLLLGSEVAAAGFANGLTAQQVGGLLLAPVAAATAGSWLLRGAHRPRGRSGDGGGSDGNGAARRTRRGVVVVGPRRERPARTRRLDPRGPAAGGCSGCAAAGRLLLGAAGGRPRARA